MAIGRSREVPAHLARITVRGMQAYMSSLLNLIDEAQKEVRITSFTLSGIDPRCGADSEPEAYCPQGRNFASPDLKVGPTY